LPDLSLYYDELAILTKSVIGENKLQRLVASSRCQRVYAIYITFERLNSKGSEKYAAEGFTGGNSTGIRHVHVAVIRSLSFSARMKLLFLVLISSVGLSSASLASLASDRRVLQDLLVRMKLEYGILHR